MFRLNNANEQTSLFSKENNWSNFQKKRINQSWAGYFHDNIFPSINEERFRVLYSNNNASCPNTPVNILIGLLIIKSITNSTDEEVIDLMLFDERVQYALHTIDLDSQPISKNMLNIFRKRLTQYESETNINLLENEMRDLNKYILGLHKIDRSIERMDSMMISSSCKIMSRVELVYTVNYNFIKLLDSIDKVPNKYKCYLEEGNKNEVIYRTKNSEEENRLSTLLNHSVALYKKYKHNKKINTTGEFMLLQRIVEEQYDNDKKCPKDNKEISPSSLQNPSDPDATFRTKYGPNHGYVANIVEAVDKNNGAMITDWEVDKNTTSDTTFLNDYLEKQKQENNNIKVEIVDGGFYSEELNEKAATLNIELHPTELVGRKPKETNILEFTIDEQNHQILKCPNNCVPESSKYDEEKDIISACFEKKQCENCPFKNKCCLNFKQKKFNKLRISTKEINIAKQRENRKNEEYVKISNRRAGIEGIPSLLRRKYRIDERPVKGLLRLKNEFSTAIIAINIKRASKIAQVHDIFTQITTKIKFIVNYYEIIYFTS